jgi:hypothetical protein
MKTVLSVLNRLRRKSTALGEKLDSGVLRYFKSVLYVLVLYPSFKMFKSVRGLFGRRKEDLNATNAMGNFYKICSAAVS